MSEIDDGNYTATLSIEEDTIYFLYKVVAEIDGEIIESELYNVTVHSSNNTPGFGVITLITIFILFAFRKEIRCIFR
jgi:hypothetical protein